MDIALAIEGKDFVLLVCEKTTTQGLTIFNVGYFGGLLTKFLDQY
jgi:hypothetical protein